MSTDAPTRPYLAADIAPADSAYRGMPGDAAFDLAVAAAPAAPNVPAENSVQNEPIIETPKPAPAKRPRTKSIEPASPVEETPAPAPAAHRKPRTGAGARFNGDAVWIYRSVNIGVAVVALAMIAISWQGLSAVGAWLLLPPYLGWLVPLAIDVALVVLTLACFPRKTRGESTWLLIGSASFLATISAAANFAHVMSDSPAGTPDLQRWAGSALAALMPFLALLMTEVLGMLATKPSRIERAQSKLAAQKAEAALKPRKPAAPRKKKA